MLNIKPEEVRPRDGRAGQAINAPPCGLGCREEER